MFGTSISLDPKGKNKNVTSNSDPALFSEISYTGAKEINYLADLEEKKKQIDFPIFQFENDFNNEGPVNDYDRLADRLYKKILQKGYAQEKKAPTKKKRKNKNPFEYDYEDGFINDEEAYVPRKDLKSKLENFRKEKMSVEQFYNSEFYTTQMAQIQEQAKKKNNGLQMKEEELERMKRQIKENIAGKHTLKAKIDSVSELAGDQLYKFQQDEREVKLNTENQVAQESEEKEGAKKGKEIQLIPQMEEEQQQNPLGEPTKQKTSDNSPKEKDRNESQSQGSRDGESKYGKMPEKIKRISKQRFGEKLRQRDDKGQAHSDLNSPTHERDSQVENQSLN